MPASMTAFAKAERAAPGGALRVELRSCNHRFLSVACNLPPDLRALETELRRRLAARFARGRIDVGLFLEPVAKEVDPDPRALARLAHAVRKVAAAFPGVELRLDPLAVLHRPEVQPAAHPESWRSAVLEVFDEALDDMAAERRREGDLLCGPAQEKLARLNALLEVLEARRPAALATACERLLDQVRELEQATAIGIPGPQREQALLLLTRKSDAGEETERLRVHLGRIEELLEAPGPIGKHLDFLLQETQRELNTLGMKLAHAGDFSDLVVEAKVLTEQLREQAQNLE